MIYDKSINKSFKRKREAAQYNASLVITGAISGTSGEHLYYELVLESSSDHRWSGKLLFFHKVVEDVSPL